MDIQTSFLSKEVDIVRQLTVLAQQSESWWTCLGGAASGVSAPLWRIIVGSEKSCLQKLEYAIVGLSPLFGDIQSLRRLHEKGVLRIILSATGVFEPNVYAFRLQENYATIVISGMDAPAIFGQSTSVAVLTQCPRDHPFALATEAFLFSCKDMARLMTLGEIESLEKRIGSEEELSHDVAGVPLGARDKDLTRTKIADSVDRSSSTQKVPPPSVTSESTALALFGGKEGLYAVQAGDGQLAWLFKTTSPVTSTPVLSDGKVFFGCYDGTLCSVDLQSGQADWILQTNEKTWNGLAVDHSVLCYASADKHIHAIDMTTGQERWKFLANSRIPAAPTIADWVVYFGDSLGRVYAVDIETGAGRCLFEKKDFWNYSVTVQASEPLYWSASQIAKKLTEDLGADKCNELRTAMGIKGLTGIVSSQMVNDLLREMDLQYKDEQTNEWRLGQKAKRIGTRTVIRKPDGAASAYIRWKEEVRDILLPEINDKISLAE